MMKPGRLWAMALVLMLACACPRPSVGMEGEAAGGESPSAQNSPLESSPAEKPAPQLVKSGERIHFGADLLWYGANTSRTNPQALSTFSRLINDLGIKSVRFDVYWGLIEKEKGLFDWTLTDDLVAAVGEDVEIVLTLYCTSEWGSRYNGCRDLVRRRRGVSVYNKPPSSIPLIMEDYGRFIDKIVNRYKGRVRYWQIENEVYGSVFRDVPGCKHANRFWIGTMQEYMALLKESHDRIKAADPDASVLAAGFTFEPWPLKRENPFLGHVLDVGKDYSDIMDIHLYLGPYEDPAKIGWAKKKAAQLGYDKPFWSTESGQIDTAYHRDRFKDSTTSAEELTLQAEEVVKRYVLAFASGVERVFLLRLSPYRDGESADLRWSHMGLTFDKQGLEKRPAYQALKTTIRKLEGYSEVTKMGPSAYQFKVGGKPVLVLWSDREEKFNAAGVFSTETVRITPAFTVDGPPEIEPPAETAPAKSIPIGRVPVFVESAM